MKKMIWVLFGTVFCVGSLSLAAAETKTAAPKKDSSTSHNFEDLLVQGKYHFSDEAVTTVEEDKVLDSLIGVRSDFKDRLKKSTARR
jgi:hypothetical protein